MTFRERVNKGLVLLDGAMGTELQRLDIDESAWDGRPGCSEVLNLTIPDAIRDIHLAYYQAGSDITETNTFGANKLVLGEYDLADRAREINRISATLVREAAEAANKAGDERHLYVAGSMGPGTKLASLEQTDYDTLRDAYNEQALGLIEGGVDLFMIETSQDILQIKAAVNAIRDALDESGKDIPILVSVTIETTGTMLVGTELQAAITALTPLGIDYMGLNCATGPDRMAPYIHQLSEQFPGQIMVMPNAGMPENKNGEMVYTLEPEAFAKTVAGYVRDYGVRIAGGCCGTGPDFIRALQEATGGLTPGERKPENKPAVASLFSARELAQDPPPLLIGERTNTNGSRKFRELLLANDWDGIVSVAMDQQQGGAHTLDVCVAYTGRDEAADMREAISRINRQITLPLVIDSTTPEVIELALKLHGGRAIINSINLEDGEPRADAICQLARRYGSALIALTIDEEGMAKTLERKIAVGKRLYDLAVTKNGLAPSDLIFDVLTFTLGSGDEAMKDAGRITLEAISKLKAELPGVFTVLGVSNISFGLAPHSRKILNSVFLHEAVEAGLDAAIINPKSIIPLYQINEEDRKFAQDLIYNRGENALIDFINHFDTRKDDLHSEEEEKQLTVPEDIQQHVIRGNKSGLEELLETQREAQEPLAIINELLIPAMKIVGDLFGKGEMQLPFVLQSAEVMKFGVGILEQYMEKQDASLQKQIVLATVRGDVHDIGKNLVDIILSNNGFKVHNIGIKVEAEAMIEKIQEVNADALGMSGLLVKSTVAMKENIEEMHKRGVKVPVLLGGAALTRDYVDSTCAPLHDEPVVYCRDAFDGLRAMNLLQDGNLDEAVQADRVRYSKRRPSRPAVKEASAEEKIEIRSDINVPEPPFYGAKIREDFLLDEVFSYLTESVLFRGRWGFRRGKMDKDAFDELLENEARPELERLKTQAREQKLFRPKAVYGYYPCQSDGDAVIIYDPENTDRELTRFDFPRQKSGPGLCVADFFKSRDSGEMDLMPLQVVTIGSDAARHSQELYANNEYREYLLFHGLSVESAEALAELLHKQIRSELGIDQEDGSGIEDFVVQKYRGSRYSFGYPACPDLEGNQRMFTLLHPEEIGVELTDDLQMTPEQTTSAFIVHHPQAKYFSV